MVKLRLSEEDHIQTFRQSLSEFFLILEVKQIKVGERIATMQLREYRTASDFDLLYCAHLNEALKETEATEADFINIELAQIEHWLDWAVKWDPGTPHLYIMRRYQDFLKSKYGCLNSPTHAVGGNNQSILVNNGNPGLEDVIKPGYLQDVKDLLFEMRVIDPLGACIINKKQGTRLWACIDVIKSASNLTVDGKNDQMLAEAFNIFLKSPFKSPQLKRDGKYFSSYQTKARSILSKKLSHK
jgi:hypothetical protein